MGSSPHHRNWANLPQELLCLISQKTVLLPDYIHFGAVCKGWRSAARENYQDRRKNYYEQPPMLLLQPDAGDEVNRGLYSILEHKTYPRPLTIPYSRRFCGSSYGWLAFSNANDLSITLLNPFSGNTVQLPGIRYDSRYRAESMVNTVTLSCDPCLNSDDWMAVTIYGVDYKLAFMRAGQDSWHCAPVYFSGYGFYKKELYVMNRGYELYRISVQDEAGGQKRDKFRLFKIVKGLTNPETDSPVYVHHLSKFYIVELGEDLILVQRRYSGDSGFPPRTVGFDVFKVRLNEEDSSAVDPSDLGGFFGVQDLGVVDSHGLMAWTDVQDLGGFCLFVGDSKPICVSAATFPECQPNCIYYTAYYKPQNPSLPYMADDVGVFDLASGQIHQFFNVPPSHLSMVPAVWISPNLY